MIKGLVLASAGFAMFVTPAAAERQDDMKEMRELVLKLQDQVDAQQQQIDEQKGVMREAGIDDERGSESALSSFLESTDFSGWVAASYFYNFNQPDPGAGGNGPFSNPFHPDHNSFQFDEAWFVIDRSPTEQMPAGFHFEILYGATASTIQGGSAHLNGNDFWIPTANVSYVTPLGPTLTAGKFGTTIGYEVAGAPSNVNITRGFTYNLFQPISHTGVTISQDFDGGFTYTLGAVNGFGTEQPDTTENKGVLWQLGWGNDTVTMLFNGFWENNRAGAGRDQLVLDGVVEITPNDRVLIWGNFDYITLQLNGDDPFGVGLSLGARFGLTDDLGLGGRFEVAHFDDDGSSSRDGELYSWTLTTDYALTDNLIWKLEGKIEAGDGDLENTFRRNRSDFEDQAVYVGTQIYYEF